MRVKFFLLVFCAFFCLPFVSNAQSENQIWEALSVAKNNINNNNDAFADSILQKIRPYCISSKNDSIQVVYYESKGTIDSWFYKDYKSSIDCFEKVIALYERLNIKSYNYLDAFQGIALAYDMLGDKDKAVEYYEKAIIKSVVVENSQDFRDIIYLNLGNIYKERGDTLLANKCYQKIDSKNRDKLFDANRVKDLEWENNYLDKITQCLDQKRYAESIGLYSDFIQGLKSKYGIYNEFYIQQLYEKAIVLRSCLNNFAQAEPLLEQLVFLSDKVQFLDKNICGAYSNLALCYAHRGNFHKVDSIIPIGINYSHSLNSPDYEPNMIYRFAGNGAFWNENYQYAIKYYEQYFNPVYTHREVGDSYQEIANQLSVAYLKTNQPQKAQVLLEKVLKTDEKEMDKNCPKVLVNVFHNMGRALMLQGNYSQALKFLNKSKKMQIKLNGTVFEKTNSYIKECEDNL